MPWNKFKILSLGKQIQKRDRNNQICWKMTCAISCLWPCMYVVWLCRGPNCVMLYFEQFALKFSHSPLFCFFYTNCRLAYSVISVLKKKILFISNFPLQNLCNTTLHALQSLKDLLTITLKWPPMTSILTSIGQPVPVLRFLALYLLKWCLIMIANVAILNGKIRL